MFGSTSLRRGLIIGTLEPSDDADVKENIAMVIRFAVACTRPELDARAYAEFLKT